VIEDPFNLERFVSAQAAVFEQVLDELRVGAKRTHWIWFIFPQMKGLGHSPQANYFGIGSLEEAVAYLRHPVLGPRLARCTRLVTLVEGRAIRQILGDPDDMKFHSSMTLFAHASQKAGLDATDFNDALKKYFNGEPDSLTVSLLL
jgi:uncharacterized protein (DUF1810 family)